MKKRSLSQLDYSAYIEHLKSKGIPFTENVDVDIDHWMEEYVCVTPQKELMKARYFSTDGGHQLLN